MLLMAAFGVLFEGILALVTDIDIRAILGITLIIIFLALLSAYFNIVDLDNKIKELNKRS